MPRRDSLFRASVVTIVANIANRGLGFVREASLARLFGTGLLLDRFVVAFSVPEYLTFIVFASLPVALLPARRGIGEDRAAADAFFWSGLWHLVTLYGALTLLIVVGAPLLAALFGHPGDAQTITLTRLLSGYLLLGALEAYFRGWLYDARAFTIPASSSFALNGIFIAGLLLMHDADPIQLAWLYLLSSAALVFINLAGVLSIIRPRLIRSKVSGVHSFFLSQMQIGLVEALALIYPIIDRVIASRLLGEGEVAALRYAYVLVMLPSSVLAMTASTSAYPWVTAKSSPEKAAELRALYAAGVQLIFLLVALAAAGLGIFAEDCVAIAFQRGAFDALSLAKTAEPIRWFALGLPAYAIVLYQMRFFYARGAIRSLFAILLVMTLIKISGCVSLAPGYGTAGLAFSSTLVWSMSAFFLGNRIRHWTAGSWRELLWPEFPKLLAVVGAASLLWLGVSHFWPSTGMLLWERLLRLLVAGCAGGVLAFGVARLVRVQLVKVLMARIFRKAGLQGGE